MDDDGRRQLFATALIVLAGVGLGAIIAIGPERSNPWLGVTILALAIGAGLVGIADVWRRK